MKKIITIALITLALTSCATTTEYLQPTLPLFTPNIPTRPTLESVDMVVPEVVITNTLSLMNYARELEVTLESWEEFYTELRRVNNNNEE